MIHNFRYTILKLRIERNDLISSYNAQHDGSDAVKLRSIDYLLSCAGKNANVVVFGLLSQLEEGKYSLEGPDGTLPLDLSQAVSFENIEFPDFVVSVFFLTAYYMFTIMVYLPKIASSW